MICAVQRSRFVTFGFMYAAVNRLRLKGYSERQRCIGWGSKSIGTFSINISSQRSERWSNESKKGKERNLRREGQIETSKLPLDCPGNLTLSLRQTFVPKSLSLFSPSRFIKPRLNWALSSEQRNATKARSCSLGCLWRATSVCAPSHYLLFYSV